MNQKRKILTDEQFEEKYGIAMPKDAREREMLILGRLTGMQLTPPEDNDDLHEQLEDIKMFILDTKHLPYFDFIANSN